ncbi:MAG: hypothetical protein U0Q14_07640 [Dermatophilaceae bacterium]
MSADSVIPGAQARRVCAVEDLEALAGSAVDTLDIASQLESRGLGDAFARRIGHEDVFHYSVYLRDQATGLTYDHVSTQPGSAGPAARRPGVLGSFGRIAVILCGFTICLTTLNLLLPRGGSELVVTVSGALSWIVSHVTGAMVWHDRSARDTRQPERYALTTAVTGLVVGLAAAWWLRSPIPVVWTTWAAAVGCLLPMVRARVLGTLAAGAMALFALVVATGGRTAAGILAIVVVFSALVFAGARLRRLYATTSVLMAIRPSRGWGGALGQSLVQCLGQILTLGILVGLCEPDARTAIAFGALAGALVSDPVLTIALAICRRVVERGSDASRLRPGLSGLGLSTALIVPIVSAVTAAVLVPDPSLRAQTGAAAATVGALGLLVSLLLRTDRAGTAALTAAGFAVLAWAAVTVEATALGAAFLTLGASAVATSVAAVLLGRALTHPANW